MRRDDQIIAVPVGAARGFRIAIDCRQPVDPNFQGRSRRNLGHNELDGYECLNHGAGRCMLASMSTPTLLMTPMRPYLVRALLAWITDNNMTPYVLVDAAVPGIQVPSGSVKDGKIVLNLSMRATNALVVEDDEVRFTARFSGRAFQVRLPMASIQAVFANETGLGMGMPAEQGVQETAPAPDAGASAPPAAPATREKDNKAARRAHLKIVK